MTSSLFDQLDDGTGQLEEIYLIQIFVLPGVKCKPGVGTLPASLQFLPFHSEYWFVFSYGLVFCFVFDASVHNKTVSVRVI